MSAGAGGGDRPESGTGQPRLASMTADGGTGPTPERIAALLDGRLDAAQRAEVLAQIEASPEAFEAYADAVAVLRELEGDRAVEATPAVVRQRRWRGIRTVGYPLAIAAGLLLVFVLARGPGGGTALLPAPHAVVAAESFSPSDAGTLAAGVPWSELRSGDATLPARARAVRIGARIADLGWRARAQDSAASAVALQIAAALDDVPAGAVAAGAYRSLASQPPSALSEDALVRAARFAAEVTDAGALRAGAWLAVARRAAQRQDTAFFTRFEARAIARSLSALGGPAQMASLVTDLERALSAPRPDWAALGEAVEALLRELATR